MQPCTNRESITFAIINVLKLYNIHRLYINFLNKGLSFSLLGPIIIVQIFTELIQELQKPITYKHKNDDFHKNECWSFGFKPDLYVL